MTIELTREAIERIEQTRVHNSMLTAEHHALLLDMFDALEACKRQLEASRAERDALSARLDLAERRAIEDGKAWRHDTERAENAEAALTVARRLGMSIEQRQPTIWALRNERAQAAEAQVAALRSFVEGVAEHVEYDDDETYENVAGILSRYEQSARDILRFLATSPTINLHKPTINLGAKPAACATCGGTGENTLFEPPRPCGDCDGTGRAAAKESGF